MAGPGWSMLPAVDSQSGAGLAGTGFACWLSPSVWTAVAAITVNENHFKTSATTASKEKKGGGELDSVLNTVIIVLYNLQGIYLAIYPLEHVIHYIACLCNMLYDTGVMLYTTFTIKHRQHDIAR